MWRTHGIMVGIWVLGVLPVLALDRAFLGPIGGGLPVDLSGVAIAFYLCFVAVQIPLSTILIALVHPQAVVWIHLGLGPLSGVLAYGVAVLLRL